jgi:acyl carrier protein
LARAAAPVTREQAYILLNDILRDVLGCDAVTLDDATPVEQVPGWDSLGQIGVLAAAEIRFGVEIRAAEAERLSSIGELIDLILRKHPHLP